MFQRFNENTDIGRVVKNILSKTRVPDLQYVDESSYLIEGCRYLYGERIIECTSSGILKDNFVCYPPNLITYSTYRSSEGWYDDETHKYLGNYLRYLRDSEGLNLMPYYNCYNATELTDVYIDPYDQQVIVCSNDHYEVEGKYVPKICPKEHGLYCGQRVRFTSKRTYSFGDASAYKVVAVPVKFDTTYTIAVESHSPVSIRGIIYNKHDGMIKEYKEYPELSDVTYYSDYLNHTFMNIPSAKFTEPFTYSIKLATAGSGIQQFEKKLADLYSRHNDLYMMIQLPKNTTSSIVVLEGDYTSTATDITQGNFLHSGKDGVINLKDYILSSDEDKESYEEFKQLVSSGRIVPEAYVPPACCVKFPKPELSLLYYNTGVSYAFSDRLVEYLLLNVVYKRETISTNISRVQSSIGKLYDSYSKKLLNRNASYGVWDKDLQNYVYNLLQENTGKVFMPFDHDGNINKDIEELLSQKGAYVT